MEGLEGGEGGKCQEQKHRDQDHRRGRKSGSTPAWRDVALRCCHPGILEKEVLTPETGGSHTEKVRPEPPRV